MAIKIYPPLVEVTNFPASQDVVVTNTPDVNANADLTDTYYPIEGGVVTGQEPLNLDPSGNLKIRGSVLTDETSYRDDFPGASLGTDWTEATTGSATIAVASSKVTLTSGATNGNSATITLAGDYGPLTLRGALSVSQRVANQTTIFGLTMRSAGIIEQGAYFKLTGTDDSQVISITQSSSAASDTQTTTTTIPAGITTASTLYYKVDVSNNTVTFSISSTGSSYFPIAQHSLHIPGPYDSLDVELSITNTGASSSTAVACDMVFLNNMNRVQMDQDFQGEPIPSQLIGAVGNTFKPVGSTPTGDLKVELSGNNTSAFGDINMAPLTASIQIDFVYGILSAAGSTTTANGGTGDTNGGRLRLQTGTNVAGSASYSSAKPAKYRPGQGIDAKFTYVFSTPAANSQQECGAGDLINGYFFGYVGTAFGIIHRNGGVQTFIAQNKWNVDTCDGTGLSAFNIVPQYGNVYRIKYPYLGFGDIKFFVQDSNVGQFMLVHVIKYANTSAATQLSNPNLNFFARVVNTGNNTNLTAYVGSVGMFLSGERRFLGQSEYAYNNKSLTAAGGLTNLLTIRNCTTFNTVSNKGLIRLTSINLAAGNLGNNAFGYLFLIKNATLGGVPAYTPQNGATADNGVTITSGQSVASVDKAGTTVTGGTNVWGSNGVNNSNAFLNISQEDIYIAPGETLTFAGLVTANASLSVVGNYILDI